MNLVEILAELREDHRRAADAVVALEGLASAEQFKAVLQSLESDRDLVAAAIAALSALDRFRSGRPH